MRQNEYRKSLTTRQNIAMPRTSSGPFGTIANLNRLCRTALVIDGILATGRNWQEVAREVAEKQYKARGYEPPKPDVVRQYFSLELAPALDPGYRSKLSYPAALGLQYPEVRRMVVAPLLDLLFGLDLPKLNQMQRKERFSHAAISELERQGEPEEAKFMRLLNHVALKRRPGRSSDQPFRPHWAMYQTLLICQMNLVHVLFSEVSGLFSRRLRPIEQEVEELSKVAHIDALALLYGLVLEALEITDWSRLRTAKDAVIAWLPNLHKLPECRRVAPLLERAVKRGCDQAVPRQFARECAMDRVTPGSWREPGPIISVPELVYGFPKNDDSLEFLTMRELDIKRMSILIEQHAIPTVGAQRAGSFPFKGKRAQPLKDLSSAVSLALSDLDGWQEGRFWIMQRGTRCAIAATGQESFPLMLVEFGYLRGDPVTDRPILAMPWILGEWLWVDSTSESRDIAEEVIQFFQEG
jgi:hypothetical protein